MGFPVGNTISKDVWALRNPKLVGFIMDKPILPGDYETSQLFEEERPLRRKLVEYQVSVKNLPYKFTM